MKPLYSVSKSVIEITGNELLLTYGITAFDEHGEKLSEFDDVSVSKNVTERIAELLNSCEVELCHFYDTVLDELNR